MCHHAYNIIRTSVVAFLTSSSHKLFTLPSWNYYPSQVCNSCIFHNQTEGFRYCLSWLNRQSDSYGCKTKTTKPHCLSWSCSIGIREQSTWVTVSSFLQIQLTGTVTAIQSSYFLSLQSSAKFNNDKSKWQLHSLCFLSKYGAISPSRFAPFSPTKIRIAFQEKFNVTLCDVDIKFKHNLKTPPVPKSSVFILCKCW